MKTNLYKIYFVKKYFESKKIFFQCLLFCFSFLIFNSSYGANYYFTGAVNSYWNNLSNWSIGYQGSVPSQLPNDTDNIFAGDTSANFLIDVNTNVTIKNLNLSGSGEIIFSTSNGKKIFVLGDLNNENTNAFTVIHNTIIFTGANEQNILGSYELKGDTIKIDKANGSLTLQNQLYVNKKLFLTAGFIISDSINFITIKNGASVTGASDSSFVNGPLRKKGNTQFSYPIGKNGIYNPLIVSAPSSVYDVFQAEYFDFASSTPNIDSQFTYIDTCEFWRLIHIAGVSNVNVKINLDNPCFHIASLDYVKVAKDSSNSSDEWVSAGNTTTIINQTSDTLVTTTTAHSIWGDITFGKTNPLVFAFAGNDTTICEGESVTLGGAPTGRKGTGHLHYLWFPSIGLSDSTIENPIATPTESTTYFVLVTDSINEYSKDAVEIIVNPKPIAHSGGDQALCLGATITIGESPDTTSGSYSYDWTPSTALSSSSIPQPNSTPNDTTQYILSVTDSIGCNAKDTMIVFVYNLPSANAGSDSLICNGASIILGGNPSASLGAPPYSYLWKDENENFISDTAFPMITVYSHYYYLQVQDLHLCVATDTVAFNFFSTVQAFAGSDTLICYGSTLILGDSSTATGSYPPFTFLWSPAQNINLLDAANPVATPVEDIIYNLVVTDSIGCKAKDSISISVHSSPTINIESSKFICNGDSVKLGDSLLISGGTPPYIYFWQPNFFIDDTASNTPLVYPSLSTNYFLLVTDSLGCHYQEPVFVNVSKPIANAGPDRNLMCNCSITLGGNPTALDGFYPFDFLWDSLLVNDFTNPNPEVIPNSNTYYSVSISDQNGCKGSDSAWVKLVSSPNSISNAILLHNPDDTSRYYSWVITDSTSWFKFHSDSTHVFITCIRNDPDTSFNFNKLTLFTGSINSLQLVEEIKLENFSSETPQSIINDDLTAGENYYLKLTKPGGIKSNAVLIYDAELLKPVIGLKLSDN